MTIFRLIRPINLLLTALTYGLGIGIARYLGVLLDLLTVYLGAGFILAMLAAASLLSEYFRPFNEPIVDGETRSEREALRRQLLLIGILLVAFAAVCILFIFFLNAHPLVVVILFALYAAIALMIAIPPFRLVDRGFGALAFAFLLASLPPLIAFILQAGEIHRLVAFCAFPLTLLSLAYLLAFDFTTFAIDQKYERRTLLTSLTWQRAVPLHHIMIIIAYLILMTGSTVDVPFALIWPSLLTLPLAIYQIIMLRNIADGQKPNWTILIVNATAIFGVTTYLLTLTFWLR
jgi:1,4-dihydroxy-2-naphthoate octaprenyltransferase